MAQLTLNLDEEVIRWIVASAAREHSSVSKWVEARLARAARVPMPPRRARGSATDDFGGIPDLDPLPEFRREAVH